MTTVADMIRARAGDPHLALWFEDRSWSYAEYVEASAVRAALLGELRRPGPFHVGVLLDNVPDFAMWLGAAALTGATIVGVNPTRRGAELARDVRHTEVQLLVTEPRHAPARAGLDLGLAADRVLDVESPEYAAALAAHAGAPLPEAAVTDDDPFLLLFTSGTSGTPKAVRCSHWRLALIGALAADMLGLTPRDVTYEAMPMFHSNALMAGWAPSLAAGAAVALRRRFSASAFLDDVRRCGATYFNYVGKPLAYILDTPPRPDDADNPLRLAFGNEAGERDLERFAARFGCEVIDAYGATEGGASIVRDPAGPPGALGPASAATTVLDPATAEECPPARFDADGRMLNPEQAIGEIVNKEGDVAFEGYWNNEEAEAQRRRLGYYWTGDLGYRDEQGYLYFAGRDYDWLRVDGENFAAAPVERILGRHPDVVVAAVYAVPDARAGDQVMAALQVRAGAIFDGAAFARFVDEQPDLGTKWTPRYVRVAADLPITETTKVLKRGLRGERWECADPVWWRDARSEPYRPFTAADAAARRDEFAAHGRLAALDGA